MNEIVYPERFNFLCFDEPAVARISCHCDSGTYHIRRANYFSKTEKGAVESMLIINQQLSLIRLMRAGDASAKQKLITNHMGLVVDVAKDYQDRGVPIFELIMEGCFGLIHALESFELNGSSVFTAYVILHIRKSIENVIRIQNDPSKLSAWCAYQQANDSFYCA